MWWTRGGRTVLDNLVLVCPRHHSDIHAEEWTIQVIDDLPWFIPPPWIDPQQHPVRNSAHTAAADTTRLAQQLWLDVGPPGG